MSGDSLAQSVRARLKNVADAAGEDYNRVLARYAAERLLARLARSPHGAQFVLKGALLFVAWTGSPHRATKDIDLLGMGAPRASRLASIFASLCEACDEPDAIEFDPDSIRCEAIREDAVYDGMRVTVDSRLGTVRLRTQVDVGFGDAMHPAPREVELPSLLFARGPVLRAYAPETVVAEKAHAIVVLGLANSRMKDYHDLWCLARTIPFDGSTLRQGMLKTFIARQTEVPSTLPLGLSAEFAHDATKVAQWRAFIRRAAPRTHEESLATVVSLVGGLVWPALSGDAEGKHWERGVAWR